MKSGTTDHILYDIYVKLLEKQNLDPESMLTIAWG